MLLHGCTAQTQKAQFAVVGVGVVVVGFEIPGQDVGASHTYVGLRGYQAVQRVAGDDVAVISLVGKVSGYLHPLADWNNSHKIIFGIQRAFCVSRCLPINTCSIHVVCHTVVRWRRNRIIMRR